LKIYRASVLKDIRLYGEMHRFIPAWISTITSPSKIGEEIVEHHPRRFGRSKYSIIRSFGVMLDMLTVFFFMRFRAKPGHLFGAVGLSLGLISAAMLGYLMVVKFYYGQDIGSRPLLIVGVVLFVASLQFITTGILAELMARVYFESSNAKPYVLDQLANQETFSEHRAWHEPRRT
jgi:hypothetical protein